MISAWRRDTRSMPRRIFERSISMASVMLSARPITMREPISPNCAPSPLATSRAPATSSGAAAPLADRGGVRGTGVIATLADGGGVSVVFAAGQRFSCVAPAWLEPVAALDADFNAARTDDNAAATRARAGALGGVDSTLAGRGGDFARTGDFDLRPRSLVFAVEETAGGRDTAGAAGRFRLRCVLIRAIDFALGRSGAIETGKGGVAAGTGRFSTTVASCPIAGPPAAGAKRSDDDNPGSGPGFGSRSSISRAERGRLSISLSSARITT